MWKKTLLAAAVGGFALSARAADTEPPTPPSTPAKNDDPIETITITATENKGFKADDQGSGKMPLSIRETPQAITVLTRDSLDDRQVFSLQQALELSAGATQFSGTGPFAGQPSFGFNSTTIRGIQIDDQYDFRDDGFVSGSYFSVPDLAIYDRVEVVKGANSVLYGRGSVGGLINRIRKKPTSERQTDIEFTGGSFDSYRGEIDTRGALTDSGNARGRLIAVYDDAGSFVEGVETKRTVLAPSVDFDLTSSTHLLVQALRQTEDIIPNTGMPLRADGDNWKAPNISRRQYNGIPTRDPYQWTIESVMAELQQKLGDDWLATLRLSSSNTDTPIRTDAYAYGFAENDDPANGVRRGDTMVLGNDFAIDRDVLAGEIQINGKLNIAGREAKLGFGADINENQYSRRGMYTAPASGNLYDGVFEQPDPTLYPGSETSANPKAYGFYAQGQIPLTDRLKVLLGARWDQVKLSSVPYHETGTPAPARTRDTADKATGRVGLTYDLNEQVSFYTVYAQSFSPELFATDKEQNLLPPETGEIYEFGAKTEWFNRRLGLNVAVYRVDRTNVPISIPVDPTAPDYDPETSAPYSVPSGLQRSDGFEIEINGRPLDGWDISLAFNTVDAAYKDKRDPFYGMQPGGTADWQLGLYSSYEIQSGPAKGFGFGASLYAIDDRGVSTWIPGTIPGYERVDLHAFYRGIKNVEINLLVRNLTDEKYVEGADRNNSIAFFGSPTAAMLSVKYSIGKN